MRAVEGGGNMFERVGGVGGEGLIGGSVCGVFFY